MSKVFTAEQILCDLLKCDRDVLQYKISQNPTKVITLVDKLLTKNDFEDLANRGMNYLKENHHPHTCIIINHDNAELLEGVRASVRENK